MSVARENVGDQAQGPVRDRNVEQQCGRGAAGQIGRGDGKRLAGDGGKQPSAAGVCPQLDDRAAAKREKRVRGEARPSSDGDCA